MYKLLLLFVFILSLKAYELPQLELSKDGKPEIVFFTVQSIIVGDKLSYRLKWQTVNATDVNMTFFGSVALSGSLTVTKDEYNRGEIVLNAWNKKSDFVDSFVINRVNKDLPPPVVFDKTEKTTQQYYNSTPYRGVRRPYPYPYPRRRLY
jgi:hypothetical protein